MLSLIDTKSKRVENSETLLDFTLPNSMIINGIALNLQTLGAENDMSNCQETKLGIIDKIKAYKMSHMIENKFAF